MTSCVFRQTSIRQYFFLSFFHSKRTQHSEGEAGDRPQDLGEGIPGSPADMHETQIKR